MTAFWDWAVAAYGGEGVADICLDLQDAHGQCVPLLLWAAWRAAEGAEVSDAQADEAVAVARPWCGEVVEPLRGVRRRLKNAVSGNDDEVRLPLREKIKAAELAAEKALMARLENLTRAEILPNIMEEQALAALCLANLRKIAHAWGEKSADSAVIGLSQALTKGDFLRYNRHR